jgi:hypothetical protein
MLFNTFNHGWLSLHILGQVQAAMQGNELGALPNLLSSV